MQAFISFFRCLYFNRLCVVYCNYSRAYAHAHEQHKTSHIGCVINNLYKTYYHHHIGWNIYKWNQRAMFMIVLIYNSQYVQMLALIYQYKRFHEHSLLTNHKPPSRNVYKFVCLLNTQTHTEWKACIGTKLCWIWIYYFKYLHKIKIRKKSLTLYENTIYMPMDLLYAHFFVRTNYQRIKWNVYLFSI